MPCNACQVNPAEERQLKAEWGDYNTHMRSKQSDIDDLQREKEGTRREVGTIEGVTTWLIMCGFVCASGSCVCCPFQAAR